VERQRRSVDGVVARWLGSSAITSIRPAHRNLDLQRCTGQGAGPVPAVHDHLRERPLAGWLTAVLGAGLVIEAIAEPRADEETAAAYPQIADTRIVPYFLILRARKP
jgi:hypothetical protein